MKSRRQQQRPKNVPTAASEVTNPANSAVSFAKIAVALADGSAIEMDYLETLPPERCQAKYLDLGRPFRLAIQWIRKNVRPQNGALIADEGKDTGLV